MGLYDRDYTQNDFSYKPGRMPQMRMGLPKVTSMVKTLLIINVAVFVLSLITPVGNLLHGVGEFLPAPAGSVAQIWRLITYQFLHARNTIWHLFVNMLGLYFLGSALENHWGSRKFLGFYLGCGVAGALFYMLLVAVNWLEPLPMIGASGAVLGLLAACAILFPHFMVFLFFIIPVPIRLVAIVLAGVYTVIVVSRGHNAGGHAAHIAGMAAGAFYVWSRPWRASWKMKLQSKTWEKKRTTEQNLQAEVDRILEKVHYNGIHSLSRREKKILKRATEQEQKKIKGRL